MDPLSIATGCAGLLAGVSQLSAQISAFVSSVRDARKDMGVVSGELSSLALCLETLRDDSMKIDYPDGFRENLLTVLKNCDAVTTEMTALLGKLSSANLLRKVQWTAMGKDDMNRLRSSLESHKSALEIGLDMTSLLLISAIKDDVADVKADTSQIPSIKQDTSQIEGLVQQIGLLRLQLDSGPVNDAKARHLQMFLDQSTSYAETVIDAIEDEEIYGQPSEDPVSDHSEDIRASPTTDANATSSSHDSPIQTISQLPATKKPSDQPETVMTTTKGKNSYVLPSEDAISERSEDTPHNPTADAEAAGTQRVVPTDRWAQIRKDAAERAQRQSEEPSRNPAETKIDDGETSGEETIESRIARIKIRVAELTGHMETGGNTTNHDSAVQASNQLPATRATPYQITATTENTVISSLSATTESAQNLLQRAPAKPAVTAPDVSHEGTLFSMRYKASIRRAALRRHKMSAKGQARLNEALSTALRGKKSAIVRFIKGTSSYSKEVGSYDEIRDLLDCGADPNYVSSGASLCTIEMANSGRLDVLELLLLLGASFSRSTARLWLDKAINSGMYGLVKGFLDSGVPPPPFWDKSSASASTYDLMEQAQRRRVRALLGAYQDM